MLSKKSRITDMLIDGIITKEVYDKKLVEFTRKHHTLSDKRKILADSINTRNDINKRMSELREMLEKKIFWMNSTEPYLKVSSKKYMSVVMKKTIHVETVCLLSRKSHV